VLTSFSINNNDVLSHFAVHCFTTLTYFPILHVVLFYHHFIIIIIIFLHGLGLTCSGIDALPSFPGASTVSSSCVLLPWRIVPVFFQFNCPDIFYFTICFPSLTYCPVLNFHNPGIFCYLVLFHNKYPDKLLHITTLAGPIPTASRPDS
jgi:hypothetical protein